MNSKSKEIYQPIQMKRNFTEDTLRSLEPELIENQMEAIPEAALSNSVSYTRPDSINAKEKQSKTPVTRPQSSRYWNILTVDKVKLY
jgi:hypothetical protein